MTRKNLSDAFAPLRAAAILSKQAIHDLEDVSLVERIAAGDSTAMRTLYIRYADRILRFVLRYVDGATAEDVVSDVFVTVMHRAKTFENRSQVLTWLIAIARHKAFDALRERQTDALDDDAAALMEDDADDPEVQHQKQDTRSIVHRCVEQLSPAHRTVIDLVYFQDNSMQDAARVIGVTRSTAKTRAFYARQRLAVLLQDEGVRAV